MKSTIVFVTWLDHLRSKKVFYEVGILVVVIDQVSKMLVRQNGRDFLLNSGGIWGFGGNLEFANGFWLVASLVLTWFLLKWVMHERVQASQMIGFAMVWGGAISNILDRAWLGGVVDWIVIFSWWPWFNIADMTINIGVFLILISQIWDLHLKP